MPVPDLFREGLARGWKTYNGSQLDHDLNLEADVAIIGSGAGGGTTAEILSAAGYKVLLIEEGPLKTSSDFKMLEDEAYTSLYQEGIGRMSKDGAITILQGRAVGGTTLINWTSSFRTPEPTLEHWAREHNVKGHGSAEMAPWFEKMEQRLGVAPWLVPPNANNDVLRNGCEKLDYSWKVIPRNVRGCWNLGYCGMGCPTNAKQSMLVTTIPATLEKGGELLYLARADRLLLDGDRITGLQCLGMDARCVAPNGRRINVKARHYVLAGGGINSPALLLRSKAPDPHGRLGKRTFLHLVNFSAGQFSEVINPFYGAPQSIYSDHFQWLDGTTGHMSYKLEVPPLQPALASTLLGGFGPQSALRMEQLPHTHVMLALMRDGFHPDSQGGSVELRGDDTPVLDYPVSPYAWDGLRRAFHSMAEIQFAAGAKSVLPLHADADYVNTLAKARELIDGLSLELYRTRLGSAHVMGGCAMGEDPKTAVTDSLGRHHQLRNLSVHDGSLFPTSIGANPQLSVYGLTAQLATALAERLKNP
ncbi:GMC family oxidoreductase [Pseudomonas gingeri NCPPB 3146 = LMG 5327]|uniref:GMC family oxidoreductase n=3 Tax=Pseudomonas gingeri TaxID=117681 RepID=A0A7Y7XYA2_9PSED|nr:MULTISPECIES: GMC family oxidoreductase [Pseudomonas]NVZ28719.1 GMC family oxidoreductase [Pseudomonas gingeri]NWC14522.1 GMC family oxidoreductase [Pseudomonas gingeri]NWE50541.1 GMC family oxidoreductase [Pseudomonas gingeri]NWE72852.1 GMC family oxidoreductase [Pseudomonas gingeri]PNQ91899.1 GMC family oxidoreductase [Pseudomonas gingeri NCPPB 3146 = LMG 5327]